ncbi:MAG: extracellular solute-binding protein [Chitinivibrionales bacterium]|nr:extracellular solute-binding protein [Chitinivibrionales bacterium]MBD3358203.1 extracellular solute-binding protein [Chitinivibrionales bacterium]
MLKEALINVCIVLVVLLGLTGCGKRETETLTLAVGGAPAELDFWEELIAAFSVQEGITVNMVRHPTDTDQRRQSLVTSMKSRETDPDVFLMDVAWVGQFAASNWLEPLDSLLAASQEGIEPFFERVVKEADTYEGRIVALPMYIDGGMLYYRTDLLEKYGFDQPPETWEQLVSYAKTVVPEERKGNRSFSGFVWQGAQYEGLMCTFLEFAASNQGGIVLEDGRISVDTPANVTAARFMHDLIHKHKISPPSTYTEMKEEEVRIFFQRGNALFERNWPYAWRLHQAENSEVKGKVGIAPLPHFEGGESASALGGWHIGISRFSNRKKDARRLVGYLTSKAVQKKVVLELGWNPGRKDVYRDPEVLERFPHFTKLEKVFTNAVARPNVPYYSYLSQTLQSHLNAALAGRESPQEALAKSEKEMQATVNRYSKVN